MTPKLAYTIAEAVAVSPWGKTKMYELINAGALPVRFQHGHRYVMHEDLIALLLKVEPDNRSPAANAA